MSRRFLCALLSLLLLLSAAPAMAQQPKPIVPLAPDEVPAPNVGQHHYLLISYDEFRNTDGVLLVTLDTTAGRILCTSISREFLVCRPDGGIGRITYIVKKYSPEALCEVISTHFGVKVEKYFLTSFDMVDEMIDQLGGITLTIDDAAARYLRVNYEIPGYYTRPKMAGAGTYWFTGRAAILYMRMRKGVGGEDGRTERVRSVFATFVEQYKDITIAQALDLLDIALANSYGTNMTMADFLEAIGYCMTLRGAAVEGFQLPTADSLTPITYAAMQTREADFEKSREAFAEFLGRSYMVAE